MPNYKKKPHLKKHQFITDKEDPLIKQINIRVSEPMFGRLKKINDYPDLIRQAIQKALDEYDANQVTED